MPSPGTPRSVIQPVISCAEGSPSGDPAARCSAAATPQPIARLEMVLTGSADPVTTAATDASVTSDATSRCNGRLRYGNAVAATAIVTANCVTGEPGSSPARAPSTAPP